jgi:hypothetical protein
MHGFRSAGIESSEREIHGGCLWLMIDSGLY